MSFSTSFADAWAAFVRAFVEIWRFSAWGVSFGDLLVAAAIMTAAVVFRRSVTRWVLKKLREIAVKRNMDTLDDVLEAIGPPVTFVPTLLAAFFIVQELGWAGGVSADGLRVETLADNALTTATAVLVFWALVRMVDPLFDSAAPLRRMLTRAMFDWFRRGLKIFLLILGGAAILEDWGIPVGPILASLGIFGVAAALGAQDLFKNLIAGLLILSERRFEAGDWIKVDGVVEGTVERIGFRSTHVRRFDKGPVYVPNGRLADNPLINFSRMSHRRIYWIIGVEYNATTQQLQEIRDGIMNYVMESKEFAHPPEVATFVRVDKFNDSSIDLMLYCFTKTTNWGEWLAIKEALALHIKGVVEGAGTGFAFPSRTLYIAPDGSGDAPEVFSPPKAASKSAKSKAGAKRKPAAKDVDKPEARRSARASTQAEVSPSAADQPTAKPAAKPPRGRRRAAAAGPAPESDALSKSE